MAAVVAAAATTANRKYEDLKKERDARVQRVEELIARARAYAKIPAANRDTDWNLAAMAPIAERRQPLFVAASNEGDIREAVAFADRANIRIVITGGLEAPLAAPLLKEKNIPVILGSVLTMPGREDAHHAATYKAAGELAQAGITFAFGVGGSSNNRLLPYEAAISVAWGLDRNRALRAITLDAATILGVADRVGSLEAGKIANLFIANGDPMEMKTQFTHIFINGRSVGLKSKHTELYERFSSRPTGVRVMYRTLRVLALFLVAFSVSSGASQQEASYTYAITGARIVPVSGATIDNGTLVFSGGVISAVGTNVTVPAGAITIAGKGLTVYPGLIDMGSAAGLDTPAVPRAENPQTTEDVERVKRDTLMRPHVRAADHMNPTASALSKSAEAGITAILATPGSDGIRGQSALVLTSIGTDLPQIGALADDRRGALVVRTPVALHVGIADRPAGGDAYPNSLMGNIAFNRQAFLDAQWYQQAKNRPHSRGARCDATGAGGPLAGGVPRLDVARRAARARDGEGFQARPDHHGRQAGG